jgi:hypothetical protein
MSLTFNVHRKKVDGLRYWLYYNEMLHLQRNHTIFWNNKKKHLG